MIDPVWQPGRRAILIDLPDQSIDLLADAFGFRVSSDRSAGTDEWTLSAGHGESLVQYVGTREVLCAFLTGYNAMLIRATQFLDDLDSAHRKLILDTRHCHGL